MNLLVIPFFYAQDIANPTSNEVTNGIRPSVKFLDEITSINAEAQRLNDNGVNIIIAVGHSGFKKDKEIAKHVPLVDVVIGGHSNTFLYTGTPPSNEVPVGPYPTIVVQSSGKKVPVVQAYAYTKYLGHLNLKFDENGKLKEWILLYEQQKQ